ncbi:MBL fold metallo-hydrolase [Nonomuraea sp. NN258]|uniref:alkyl/aryl-sulfatase n=1 Tax=Nonomuraea antri TaxID=2730852 RepID=UPI0015692422|nr:alkyl sulfatase dimerization domain-containing protein [Nonomuraea antri]NRQ39198.1 MBL fold metallo-hydrolase [Nonomuraea antri]
MGDYPFGDRQDFDDANRGFVGTLHDPVIRSEGGVAVWDCDAYDFMSDECPDTADPSLWRQGQLGAKHGLFEVADGIYQVRGLDLSNVTFVEGATGVIVVDPLMTVEPARAALDLYRRYRGERQVSAVVYTDSHADHFGGVRGVTDGAGIPIVAPEGFLDHAVIEYVYAGAATARRAIYMYAPELDRGPAGQIGSGLGMTRSTGELSLIAPTLAITRTGQREVLDGVTFDFQVALGGGMQPVQMNAFLPERRALYLAETAVHTMHNLLTPRGAPVRDARAWAASLAQVTELFGVDSDVLFASHHWPTWGGERIRAYLIDQHDLYAYLHDQTLRMINKGMSALEIAEELRLPPSLEQRWYAHGYYGSTVQNVKAVYQRYLGWFDGNPAHLWEYPPVEAARRYVEYMGGAREVLLRARKSLEDGDLRWVATVVNHVVFADPDNTEARELLATAYERLAHGAENGTWRNFYLTGAEELRGRLKPPVSDSAACDIMPSLTVEQLFEMLAVKIDGPRAWHTEIAIDWTFTDLNASYRLWLTNGVLWHTTSLDGRSPDLSVTLTKPQLVQVLTSGRLDGIAHEGDASAVAGILSVLEPADHQFPIVTP